MRLQIGNPVVFRQVPGMRLVREKIIFFATNHLAEKETAPNLELYTDLMEGPDIRLVGLNPRPNTQPVRYQE